MLKRVYTTIDGNEAVAHIAYHTNEVIAIYPITPSSPIGEWADVWASAGKPNIWGSVPSVVPAAAWDRPDSRDRAGDAPVDG